MFGKFNRHPETAYPGITEAEPSLYFEHDYPWGSLKITEQAKTAYGLTPQPDLDTSALSPQLDTFGYKVDVLLAGPGEIAEEERGNSDGVAGLAVDKAGVRLTIAMTQDKDIAGVGFAAQALHNMTADLDADEIPQFLMERGPDLQDELQEKIPLILAHTISDMAGRATQDGFMFWVSRQDTKDAVKRIMLPVYPFIGGMVLMNGIDLWDDGRLGPVTAGANVAYVGLAAFAAKKGAKRELLARTPILMQRLNMAQSVAGGVSRDLHQLLCPGQRAGEED